MIVIPSLEVRDGVCRPEGSVPTTSLIRKDSGEVLRSLVRFGFFRIHIADLESRAGRRGTCNLTNALLSDHATQFQVSSPLSQRDQIDDLLRAGASFAVVGPSGVDDIDWLAELITDDSRTVIVAANVNAHRLRSLGNHSGIARDAVDWIEDLSHLALGAVLIRAVDDEGQSAPCDFALLEDLVETAAFPILASGVLETVGELDALQDRGVAGVLLGESLHTGRIDPWIAAQEFRS